MPESLKGKVVVITGAGSGIGRATCLRFAEQGAIVAAVDIDGNACEKTIEEVNKLGPDGLSIMADVSSAESCRSAIEKVINKFGTVDVLFNNAGITRRADVLGTSEDEWDKVINVNLKSVFLMSKYVIPHMQKKGAGNIINTASGWGINGGSKAVSYCASKGGVVLLTKAMALDHGRDNIRVNCICPGDTETPMLLNEAAQLGLKEDQLILDGINRPLGRVGSPNEIADVVVFLASDKSSFVTGTALIVDGGGLAGSL
jgi:NAD(P)-dependent dehydrogenase (short-subunit alcohol dehydrogenase family)